MTNILDKKKSTVMQNRSSMNFGKWITVPQILFVRCYDSGAILVQFESCHYLFQSLIFLSSVDISLFQELEQCYGIKFLQTEEIYLYQSFRKQSTEFLFETLSNWDDYVEVDILTKFHSL